MGFGLWTFNMVSSLIKVTPVENRNENEYRRTHLTQTTSVGFFFLLRVSISSLNQFTASDRLSAMADDEVIDPKKYLEESCKPKCVKQLLEYQACVKRILDDESGHKHCTGQYFDYWHCIDKCVAPKLFAKLK